MSGGWRPITAEEQESWQVFGGLLARTRQNAGLTQYQLACAAGMTARHLQRLEAGDRRTRPSTLWLLADFLGRFLEVEPDVLIGTLLKVSGVTLAPETAPEYQPKMDARWEHRAGRMWLAELERGYLARCARRRSTPEDVRRRAGATLRVMRENAGRTG